MSSTAAHRSNSKNVYLRSLKFYKIMPPRQEPLPRQAPVNHLQVVEQFHKFKPPTFNGREGPSVLED
ncbi:hypothetical protein ACS0TY_006123 [Phlomoides rotata]